ncbi:MAG: preprotein translocase subunit SecG [Candidatus Omnitrophota bacterium]
MHTFLLIVHIIAAVLLVVVVLVQRGRGGGLIESFSGVESMFGTKTNQFLTRMTAIIATLFLCTSIVLALLAARQTRSLIKEDEGSLLEEPASEDSQSAEQTQLVPQEDEAASKDAAVD